MKPTKADREAFAREYWPEGVARGTRGDVWIETGTYGNPAWDAGASAACAARAEGAATALADPKLVLEAAEMLLRSCVEHGVSYNIHLSIDGSRFDFSRHIGPNATPFTVECPSLSALYFADEEEEARRG